MRHKIHKRRLTEVLTFVCVCGIKQTWEVLLSYLVIMSLCRAGDSRVKENEFNILFEL